MSPQVLALAGGVGGAKLAFGLYRALAPCDLTIVVNTGDDESFHGLHVSPDVDTMIYTLSGLAHPEQGWGLAGETFTVIDRLAGLGGETWFRLGDRDLATHLRRTEMLAAGATLSQVTAELAGRAGIACQVAPMTDAPVRTIIETDEGALAFQEYFVRRRCEPRIRAVECRGAAQAAPSPAFNAALQSAGVIVFCPSNPFVSIDPILAVSGVRIQLTATAAVRVGVSPIVGGKAIKGPAAKMFMELGVPPSSIAVAERYRGLCDIFVIDGADAAEADAIAALGMQPLVAPTIMTSDDDRLQLAQRVLQAAADHRAAHPTPASGSPRA